MTKKLPFGVSSQVEERAKLSYWGGKNNTELIDIQIGSDEWGDWLTQSQSFRMTYVSKISAEPVKFTVRPEQRKNKKVYWQAWKTIKGKTTKKYVGPSTKVTKARLDEVGEWFYEQVKASRQPGREEQLLGAIQQLTGLVEDLINYCHNASLIEHAQEELKQVKHKIETWD